MTISISEKVSSLGHSLPRAPSAVANYVPVTRSGNILHISGQISLEGGKPAYLGRLGAEITIEEGRKAAQAAALGVLAQIAAHTNGTVSAVHRVLRLGVFVAASPEFTQHPEVANGASDLIVAVFGDAGRHARAAVGVSSLPRGAAVEVEAVVQLEN